MRSKLVHESDGQRTFVAVLEAGEEAMAQLTELARQERLSGAGVTGIGAFSDAVLRYFDWRTKDYRDIPVSEQVEVAALVGDVATGSDGEPVVHVHVVLGRRDGAAMAGHLKSGRVRPTLELIVTETPAHLLRRPDPSSGLNLIDL